VTAELDVPEQSRAALDMMALSPATDIGHRDVTQIRAELHTGALATQSPEPRDDGVRTWDEPVSDTCWVRVFEPPEPSAEAPVLFLHGGGWTICDVETHHELAAQLAADTGRLVASVEYRLAPEHPFPAPLDDCRDAARWLAARTDGSGDIGVVVAGDSSGGNLAAGLALAAVSDKTLPRIVLQVLLYPVLDDDFTTASYRTLADGRFGLSEVQMRWYWDAYAPTEDAQRDPLAAPGKAKAADLRGVAPAFIGVGDLDPLLDEARSYAARLAEAGVPVELHVYRGGFHGFHSFRGVLDLAAEAAADVARAIGGRT
jgi:acetyl esterase